MVPLLVLLLLLALFGGLGFAIHALWIVLVVALVVWALGFIIRSAEGVGARRSWYRW